MTKLGGDNLVLSIIETKDGTVWFGGTGILYAYRDDKFILYNNNDLQIPIAPISLLQARDGTLWFGSMVYLMLSEQFNRMEWFLLLLL